MKRVADVLQQLQIGKNLKTPFAQEPLPDVQTLSESEKQTFEQLLAAGASRECLLIALKNRLKHLSDQPKPLATMAAESPELPTSNNEKPPAARRRLSSAVKRVAYVLNPFPEYQLPEWMGRTPPMNQRLVVASKKQLPTALWDRLHALHKVKGMRLGISIHRVRAIAAIVPCLLATMNVSSLQCLVCVKSIAAQCGLTSSRVSRALADLANVGILNKQLKRGLQGRYQPLGISLTRKTLQLFGVSDANLNQAQKLHKKFSKPNNQKISITQNVIGSVAQSLANFKQALRLKPSQPKTNGLATLVKQVEETLQAFGLERNSNLSPG